MARTKQPAKKNASSGTQTLGSVKKSQFNIKQKSKSPFSSQSQAKKTKVKTSQNKALRKNVAKDVLHEKSKVAALEKQIKSMQDKIRLIEKNQKQLENTRQAVAGPRTRPVTRKMAREEPSCVLADLLDQPEPRRASAGAKSKKKKPSLLAEASSSSSCRVAGRKRKTDEPEDVENRQASKVAYIFCGDGGERDLMDHLRRSSRVKVISTETLPDIDASDLIHGLDPSGTSRDVQDFSHRCADSCPVDCEAQLRANEIIIYESIKYNGKLFGRKRIRGRFVSGLAGQQPDVISLDLLDCRVGGRAGRRRANSEEEEQPRRPAAAAVQRLQARRRARLAGRLREPAEEEDFPPPPAHLGESRGLAQRLALLLDSPPVSESVAHHHGWSSTDKSFNIVLKDSNSLVMRRHPIAQSTDCIRTGQSYTSGLHQWELTWPARQRGTHAVVGVGTSEAPLHAVGYQSLLGNSTTSWGWDLGRLKAFHNNQPTSSSLYPATVTHLHQWNVPDIFTMILDMDRGRLGFAVGDQFLGWAHHNLKSHGPLYPMVSTVWGQCEVKLRYLGGLTTGFSLSLQDVARTVLRDQLGRDKEELERKVESLWLPTSLKNFIKFH